MLGQDVPELVPGSQAPGGVGNELTFGLIRPTVSVLS